MKDLTSQRPVNVQLWAFCKNPGNLVFANQKHTIGYCYNKNKTLKFAVFDTYANGLNALVSLLKSYEKRGWLLTPTIFLSHYCPGYTKRYENAVWSAWNFDAHVFDLPKLAEVVVKFETGESIEFIKLLD